ncbi:unnamed protein product [Cylindrotheca closterium]|uniref:CAAX prenyl protease 2/Lysostaphin resistance protein A-like domain-containing protein n=1 Tax=Cylindrotheca closterium TaxID=2856 RepID=A0AAD2PW07_9STRA|nr:unnamed protein product [Cylindrotheca closterium]
MADSTMVSTASQAATERTPTDVELSGVSLPLIRSICYNQISMLMLSTAAIAGLSMLLSWNFEALDMSLLQWNGGQGLHSIFDLSPTPFQMIEGMVAVAPLIGLERLLEESDDQGAIQSGFATSNMVLSLFGRRRSVEDIEGTAPELMAVLALGIALCTGLSEELMFRSYAPSALFSLSNSIMISVLGQAIMFALVHVSPSANASQNRVMGGLQFTNGLWYGMFYQMTGGDILPCIIAHVVHDMYIFCSSWDTINNQMDYTEEAYKKSLPQSEESAMSKLQEMAGPVLNRETLNFARRFFYAFDSKQQGSLSLQDVQRAVDYAFLKEENPPKPQVVKEMFNTLLQARVTTELPSKRVGVSEFLCLLFALKSNTPIMTLE